MKCFKPIRVHPILIAIHSKPISEFIHTHTKHRSASIVLCNAHATICSKQHCHLATFAYKLLHTHCNQLCLLYIHSVECELKHCFRRQNSYSQAYAMIITPVFIEAMVVGTTLFAVNHVHHAYLYRRRFLVQKCLFSMLIHHKYRITDTVYARRN